MNIRNYCARAFFENVVDDTYPLTRSVLSFNQVIGMAHCYVSFDSGYLALFESATKEYLLKLISGIHPWERDVWNRFIQELAQWFPALTDVNDQ